MSLTIAQLFAPMGSGVVAGVTPANVAAGTWLAQLLANGQANGLPVTNWNSQGVAWTEFLDVASQFAISDANISLIAQGGFLDFCATGTVTYTNAQGQTVTVAVSPDPSVPGQNPTGAVTWLDVLADSAYGIGTGNADGRIRATAAGGTLYLVNTTGGSLGIYNAGTFHVANSRSGATYTNSSLFSYTASPTAGTSIASVVYGSPVTINTSVAHGLATNAVVYIAGVPGLAQQFARITVTGANSFTLNGVAGAGAYVSGGIVWIPQAVPFAADVIGPGSNASAYQVTIATTSVPGGYVSNVDLAWAGSPWESNTQLTTRCRAQLQAASPNGAKGAYYAYAIQAGSLLAARTPPSTLSQAITRVSVGQNTATGANVVTVANAGGAVTGAAGLFVQGATGNGVSPIVLQVGSTAGLANGMQAIVAGVNGNTNANGTWVITVVDATHLSLNGSTGNGAWTTGGIIEVGDLGLVDSVLQQYATPNSVTTNTQSATTLAVTIVATVYIPAAKLADYGSSPTSNKGVTALTALFPSLPIGGTVLPGAASGVIDYSTVLDTLFDAGQSAGVVYTQSVQNLTINGAAASLPLSATQVATVASITVNVVPV